MVRRAKRRHGKMPTGAQWNQFQEHRPPRLLSSTFGGGRSWLVVGGVAANLKSLLGVASLGA